jgi:hypothetical protein
MGIITHLGYFSGYTKDVFSEETFTNQYDNDIYRYRILSKHILLLINDLISDSRLKTMDNMFSDTVKFMDDSGTLSFYISYLILNSLFFILSTIVFYKINTEFIENNKINLYRNVLIYTVSIPIFEYVTVPYDYSAFFFNYLIIYYFLKYQQNNKTAFMILLNISVILGTLNRETSALALSFILVVTYSKYKSIFKTLKLNVLPIVSFMLTYLLLRLIFGFSSGLIDRITIHLNLISILNLFGIAVGIIAIYIVYMFVDVSNIRKKFTLYLILSSPYIIVSLFGGITYEIRLWAPLLINLYLLALLYSKEKYNVCI